MALNPELRVGNKSPSLWVEKLGIFSAAKYESLIREVSLRRGVNVIWAKEPAMGSQTDGSRIVGHGVGKTSFCLLLRYCLGDTGVLTGNLRTELKQHFKYGGVGAIIHVNGQAFAVFRFFAEGKDFYARADSLEALLLDENPQPYSEFESFLEENMLANLSARKIPETGQAIEWNHLLAWLTRDQGSRYASFFKWRTGEGIRLQRPALDPPIIMRAVLGLMETQEQALLKSIYNAKKTLQQSRDRINQRKQQADQIRLRIVSDLRNWVGAADGLDLYSGDLFQPSVYQLLDDKNKYFQGGLQEKEVELRQFEESLQPLRTKHLLEKQALDYCINELQLLTARQTGNEKEIRKLQEQRNQLAYLAGNCTPARIPFRQCTHIQQKMAVTSFQDKQEIRSLGNSIAQQAALALPIVERRDEAQRNLQDLQRQLDAHESERRRLQMARDTAFIESRRGTLIKEELERWQNTFGTPESDQVMAKAEQGCKDQEEVIRAEEAKLTILQNNKSERAKQLSRMTDDIARHLLQSVQGVFESHNEHYPFRLLTGSGEAHKVLDVLMGDLVCLLDATHNDSAFPAFLVHDCPREADMSQWLYEQYLQLFLELDTSTGSSALPPFQYIITTTSEPPRDLQTDTYLRLRLSPDAEDNLLFRRYLKVQKDLYSETAEA